MIGIKTTLRILSLLAVAVAVGHYAESRRGRFVAGPDVAVEGGSSDMDAAVTAIVPVAAMTDNPKPDLCAPTLQLQARPSAVIDLVLSAPCHRGERAVLRHAGLSFTATVGPDGQVILQIPAFERSAMVAAYLDTAQVALGQVTVPDIAQVSRLAVQMPPEVQIELRAATADRVYVRAADGAFGRGEARVLALGAAQSVDPLVAQVYSHPGPDLSAVELSLDLRITDAACGRTVPLNTWLAQDGKLTQNDAVGRRAALRDRWRYSCVEKSLARFDTAPGTVTTGQMGDVCDG